MNKRLLGISALVRCKDEADSVYLSLLSIKDLVDEIVFIDNASVDNSISEAKRFASDHFANKNFVIKSYDKDVTFGENLAEMNNYALSFTSCSWIMKWDVDTIAHTTGKNSILRLREEVLRDNAVQADVFRYGFFNLWGDYAHFLQSRFGDSEYGPTGCGLEIQGLEKRLYKYDQSIRFEMEQYAEHFWEAIRLPLNYRELYLNMVPGIHLQTVKPSVLVGRRFFLTRYTPKDRDIYKSFSDFVNVQIKTAGFTSLAEFGKRMIIDEINLRGSKFMREYPSVMFELNILKSPLYRLIFNNNGKCIDRKEPIVNYNYLEDQK